MWHAEKHLMLNGCHTYVNICTLAIAIYAFVCTILGKGRKPSSKQTKTKLCTRLDLLLNANLNLCKSVPFLKE